MMLSSGPKSQCALGLKEKSGTCPQRRTSTFSESSLPRGTDSSGMLGIAAIRLWRSSSTFARSSSSDAILFLRSETSALAASASSFLPSRMRVPIASLSLLRLACNCSTCVMRSRRFLSSSTKRSRSQVTFREAIALSTRSRFSRTNLASNIISTFLCVFKPDLQLCSIAPSIFVYPLACRLIGRVVAFLNVSRGYFLIGISFMIGKNTH